MQNSGLHPKTYLERSPQETNWGVSKEMLILGNLAVLSLDKHQVRAEVSVLLCDFGGLVVVSDLLLSQARMGLSPAQHLGECKTPITVPFLDLGQLSASRPHPTEQDGKRNFDILQVQLPLLPQGSHSQKPVCKLYFGS